MSPTDDPLATLAAAGVSIWLDDLGRRRLDTGSLRALVDSSHVTGVTSNPSIFAKSIGEGADYATELAALARAAATAEQAVRALTTHDVRDACELLAPVHEASGGRDGFVSLEVDPRLARDTDATIAQAGQLWAEVGRPNLMIKIPGTAEGLPAVTASLASGINVNVTLIFGLDRYEAVMAAWLDGLEQAVAAGHDVVRLASVASFFVSRLDSTIDALLAKNGGQSAAQLQGRAAVANARLAYARHRAVIGSARWTALAAHGAQPQRPLWASTSTKNPAYDDTMYVVDLVAPGCVNTMPEGTLQAVADHGRVLADTITGHVDDAASVMRALAEVGVDYDDVVADLERAGVESFTAAWEQLLAAVQGALDSVRT